MNSDMLLTDFYQIRELKNTDETTWVVSVELNPAHELYKGHFPVRPVVPGVCMVQIIKESTEKIVDSSLQYFRIGTCKFLYSIDPNVNAVLNLTLNVKDAGEGTVQLTADGKAGETDFIKLKGQLIKK